MGIAYTLKQFYNRQVYIVAGMYETAFDQKYICNGTSSVILPYPLHYIKIVEIRLLSNKNNKYICTIYIRLNTCFMSIPRCTLRENITLRLLVNGQVFTETYLPLDYDMIFFISFNILTMRFSSGCWMEIWRQHISKRRYIYIYI
jgi:hypothetical protein